MTLSIMLNVQKVSAQKTILEKRHEGVLFNNGRDAKSHLVKHAIEKCYKYPKIEDLNIIGKNYGNNAFQRKVAVSSLIKYIRPTLNTHEKSVPLKLFN